MPIINPVDLTTLGARVTDPVQLTKGRWYAVRTNCDGTHNPLVHAKYTGMVGRSLHEFEVCDEDYRSLNRSLGLSKRIHRNSNGIRTGKLPISGVCEVFKFKRVVGSPVSTPEKSPYEDSEYGTCARYGLKPGGKFKVINADRHNGVAVGDIVTLREDDGSSCPEFIREATGRKVNICLYRLVPVVANQSNVSAPAVTLSPIDQVKSEIDALNAQKQIKQEEIDKLTKDVATIGGEVDKLKQKVADSLKEYLPEPKKPIW